MNILVMTGKGGAGKTTTSITAASYLEGCTFVQIDKINKSTKKLKANKYFKAIQVDFKNENSEGFIDFQNILLEEGVRVIDIGAVMLEKFHDSMQAAHLYDLLDLVIIPAMDGDEDFEVALQFINALKGSVPPEKFMFAFSRYNDGEYADIAEQYDIFFDNVEPLKKVYGIELKEENYFAIKDSRAIKKAKRLNKLVRELADEDIAILTKRQREEKDEGKRETLTKLRTAALTAQNFEREFIIPMMKKIAKKLGV